MKREILTLRRHVCDCCPGHDDYPNDTYGNRRSKRARARDKRKEHRHARRVQKFNLVVDAINANINVCVDEGTYQQYVDHLRAISDHLVVISGLGINAERAANQIIEFNRKFNPTMLVGGTHDEVSTL